MKCPKCGAELARNSLSCKKCESQNQSEGEKQSLEQKTTPIKEHNLSKVQRLNLSQDEKISISEMDASKLEGYLLCPPFRPMKLYKDAVFSIGRDESNDLILPSAEVSRYHASIKFESVEFILRDLGSANSTIVNQEPIKEYSLQDGDVIYIGNNFITFKIVLYGASGRFQISVPILDKTLRIGTERLATYNQNSFTNNQNFFTGNIESIGLFPVLQMLAMEGKTGCLKIQGKTPESAIYFMDGFVVDCKCGSFRGIDAFYEVLGLEKGIFEFDSTKAQEITMSESVQTLLLEFARRIDEMTKR